jgi:hypothetical protein
VVETREGQASEVVHTRTEFPFGGPAAVAILAWSLTTRADVTEEARTRGFAAPAFAGSALSKEAVP